MNRPLNQWSMVWAYAEAKKYSRKANVGEVEVFKMQDGKYSFGTARASRPAGIPIGEGLARLDALTTVVAIVRNGTVRA